MFSFNFASKMLNTIMGTEETPQQQGAAGQPPPHGMAPGQPQQGARPMAGFQPVRPAPQGPGGSPRPGYGGPPTFSGPRPSPGARPGPPTFGGPQRLGGPGMPHRFNGPQPPPGSQAPQRQMPPNQAQQQQQQQQPLGMRGPGPAQMQNQGVNMGPMRPRGPIPAQQQQHPVPPKPAGAVVPDVDLSHLSAEEREMIESVMAKAQQLEQEGAAPAPPLNAALGPGQSGAQRMMRPEDQRQGVDFAPRICPICRQRDMSGREGPPGQECMECRTMVCKACGGMSPHPETKRPEWTCGNCIKRRRMGPPTTIGNSAAPLGQQNLGPRPSSQFIQSVPSNNQNQQNWDPNRRPSTGGVPGMPLAGSPQQQQQQQRWESERESDKIESLEVESWKNDVGQSRKLSSDLMSPPQQLTEQLSEELYNSNQGPYRTALDLDYNSSNIPPTASTTNTDPYENILSSPPQFNPPPVSMSTTTSYLPSSSVEGVNRPPSFAEVMRSRSQSIELEKGIMPEQSTSYFSGSATGSRRASADSFVGMKPDRSGSIDTGIVCGGVSNSGGEMMMGSSTSQASQLESTIVKPSPIASQSQQRQVSSIDEKASSLMEELSKLQSAVDNTLKRRQRQQVNPLDNQMSEEHRFLSRSRSPSPSPTSPVKDNRFSFKFPDSPSSPFRSPPRSDFHSPGESPDSPEVPGVRKAIVLKEHDLDDYKSSSDEESGSGSDEEHKGGIMNTDAFYDHSPGEVYTIPEEEDEGGSPTGGDLVTSLSRPGIQGSLADNGSPRRRLLGQEAMGGVPGAPPDQRHTIRPQLRPQRSLDNRLPAGSVPNQDIMANQLDGQSQNVMFPNGNNSQLTNQMGRVDNQGMGNQMNVNTSMGVSSMTNQMSAMTSATGTIPGMMQQPQQQQQQNHHSTQQTQQSLLQQQQLQQPQQSGFASTSAPTSTMDYHQPQNQFTMANNNMTIQQPQQQHQQAQFGSTGIDGATVGTHLSGSGDWNSNLALTGQSVQCSTNSVSPINTDQQFSMGQTQPYQQMNSFSQQTPQQQQPQNQQQVPFSGTPGDMTGLTSQQQQQQPNMQPTSSVTSFQTQQQQQQQQQNQLQNQFNQSNALQFQKNQLLGQNQPMQQQTQIGLTQQQNAQLQLQQQQQQALQQNQQQQQQQPQSMNQQDPQQQQVGQMHTMMGQQQPMSTSTSHSFTGLQNQSLNMANTNQAQQQWQQSSPSQMYDQSGRSIPTSASQFAQGQQQNLQNAALNANAQQQMMNMQNQQQQQYSQQQMLQIQQQSHLNQQNLQHQQQHSQQHLGVNTPGGQVPTSKSGSISGLLADFSRALGLGTSPRPSPSEDKSEPFPVPSSGVGATGVSAHGQGSYDPFHQQHSISGQQVHQHGLTSGQAQQQVQQSAFTPIHEGSLAYLQRQQQQHSYLQQQPQALQSNLGLQGLQYSSGIGLGSSSQLLSSSSQQYPASLLSSQAQQQHTQVLTQGGLIAQQQAPGLGVGVVGALSPAQAHMYQQQMALQHQQQHLKKTSRRAHLSSGTGDVRRDGTSTVLIGGQGLAISALTPAVVTSLGTFIGGSLLQQPVAVTPLGTPIGTPVGTPRSGRDPGAGDSSDTMSETDSQKSLRMRRKLPCLPPDQEAAPLPSTKKRERHRSQEFRSLSPMRLSSMDGTAAGRSYPLSSLSLSRPSASESNLRKLTMGASDPIPRPGSALGCLQASSVISSVGGKQDSIYPLGGNILSSSPAFAGMNLRTTTSGLTSDLTTTTSVLSGLYPSYKQSQDSWSSNLAELAAALPPDLRHLLNKGSGGVSDHDLSGLSGLSGLTSSLGDTSLNVGSHLPSYMRTLREQLQEERRQLLSEERRRLEALRERDRELGARLDAVTSRAGSEALRSRADLSRNGGAPRSAGASPLLNRKLKGHRRQLSDPKLSLPFSPIQEDGDSELQDFDRVSSGLLRPPYKSYEYESLEDSALLQRPATAHQVGGDWDHSQSYLASSWAAAGGALRETAITSMGGHEEEDMRNRMGTRMMGRRSSEGEAWQNTSVVTRSPSSTREKRHTMRKHRKSRSWHPSPYVSEEEDEEEEDSLSREEKKARIKAEIARRRQQIQERAGMHGDLSASRIPGGATEHERHSVLKSVDQLLRDQYGRYEPPGIYGRVPTASIYHGPTPAGYASSSNSGRPTHHHHHHHHHHHSHQPHHLGRITPGGHVISPCASEEDRSIERIASTFRSDHDYASMLYDRLGEMSPLATDSESMGSELGAPAAMPLLPDMPTRSRRLLEDLGSAPIGLNEGTRGASSSGQSIKGRSAHNAPQTEGVEKNCKPPIKRKVKKGDEDELGDLQAPLPPRRPSSAYHSPRDSVIAAATAHWDSSSPGSSNPPSRRSSRSRSLVPVIQSDSAGVDEKQLAPSSREQSRRKSEGHHSQRSKKKYSFPTKRYLLSRDPKDRSVGGNGVGMRVVGGKELPDCGGKLAAYVARIFPGGLVEHIGGINEGDVVVEWDGHSLGNKTFEDVRSILDSSSSKQEFEVVIRTDFNFKYGKPQYLVSGGEEDYNRRQSDCGTDVGSVDMAQQDTTDDNESDKSRHAEGTYSSSCTLASECTGSKSAYPQSSAGSIHQTPRDEEEKLEHGIESSYKSSTSITVSTTSPPMTTSSLHQSTLIVDEGSGGGGGQFRRHSAMPSLGTSSGRKQRRPSVISSPITDMSQMANIGSGSYLLPCRSTRASSTAFEHTQVSTTAKLPLYRRHFSEGSNILQPTISLQKASLSGRPSKSKRRSNGQIHLQICHDPKANILYVTVIKASLIPKQLNEDGTDQVSVDPYIVCNIYPERVLENQRRTRHIPMCSEPEYNQTMVYPNVSVNDLKDKFLEVCAWNYNPTGDDELFGKVILPFSEEGILDEHPHAYPLRLEEKPYRKRGSSSILGPGAFKSSSITSSTTDLQGKSRGTSCYPLSSTLSLAGGIHKKIKVGKMSIMAPGTITSSSTSFPTDCHATFCVIL